MSGARFPTLPLPFPHAARNASSHNESLLRESLTLASEPWARDFLFETDPATDVCALTSPAQLQHALPIDCLVSLFERSGEYGGLFNMDFECRWLIVPLFNVPGSSDSLTAEVVVQVHQAFRNSRLYKTVGIASIVRMVRSNITGDILFVQHQHAENLISVHYFNSQTKTKRRRVLCRARRDAFLEFVRPTGLDFAGMVSTLTIVKVIHEGSNCPVCNLASLGAECVCSSQLKRPLHPLEFASSRCNLLFHSGTFSGSCHISLFSKGKPFAQGTLSSTTTMEGCFELGLVKRMAEMGIKSRMSMNSVVSRLFPRPVLPGDTGITLDSSQLFSNLHTPPNPCFNLEHAVTLPQELDAALAHGRGIQWEEAAYLRNANNAIARTGSAPCAMSATVGGSVMNDEVAMIPDEDLKLQRQIRNREAAARSNMRRKKRREGLKHNLSEARTRRMELERRENELKRENANLRARIEDEML